MHNRLMDWTNNGVQRDSHSSEWSAPLSPMLSGMNTRLRALVAEYLAGVELAMSLLQKAGVHAPSSHMDWILNAPASGELEGGATFRKHGVGCTVHSPDGDIDFDFGTKGEYRMLDVWRLILFAGPRLGEFGFASEVEVVSAFQSSVTSGELKHAGYANLHFLAENAA